MGNRLNGKLIISLIIVFLLILPAISYAQKQRIRVTVRNASIRMQPNVDSEVVLNPPVGSTFEIEKKLGEWYEVKFTSDIGVLITGYIHSMFVEVIEEQPEPEREIEPQPAKPKLKPVPARIRPQAARQTRFNVALGGLFSSANMVNDYTYSFPYLGEDLFVYDMLESPEAFGFTAGVGVFVTPRIELTASVATQSGTPWWGLELWVPSPYFFSDPDLLEYYEYDYVDTDSLATAPTFKKNMLSFGINIYVLKKNSLGVYVGGGGTLIKATLDLVYDVTFTHNWYPISQTHDVTIDSITFEEVELSAFGAHFRAGVDFKVGRNISLFAEGRYIAAKKDQEYPLDPDETLNLDLGGGNAILGIKVHF